MSYTYEVNDFISPSFQPDIESKLISNSFVVDETSPLSGIIADFFEFITGSQKDDHYICLLPDSLTYLFINLEEQCIRPFLFTSVQSLNRLVLNPLTKYLCVRFFPGLFGMYFHCDNKLFLNQTMYLDNVMPKPEYIKFILALSQCRNFTQRIHMISGYTGNDYHRVRAHQKIIQFAMNRIIRTSGTIDIKTLSRQSLYSQRYIRKLFFDYVGISPKALCEVVKFQKSFVIHCNTRISLCEIAMLCGYYDHSQMNKAYLHLTGNSPTSLRQLILKSFIPVSQIASSEPIYVIRMKELEHSLKVANINPEAACMRSE